MGGALFSDKIIKLKLGLVARASSKGSLLLTSVLFQVVFGIGRVGLELYKEEEEVFPLFDRGSYGARPFIHSSDTFNKLYVHNTIKSGPMVVR